MFFLQPLEKCCDALSSNMLTLTFVRSIDLVAHLNINDIFYNPTIIKQNNMTYQRKIIFCICDGFGHGFGVSTYILVTRPVPVFWNRGKLRPKLNENEENPSNWVWFGRVTTDMSFVAMPTHGLYVSWGFHKDYPRWRPSWGLKWVAHGYITFFFIIF